MDIDTILVGFAGRFTSAKGVTLFIRAVSILQDILKSSFDDDDKNYLKSRQVAYIMIGYGDSDYVELLQKLILQENLNIIFTGGVEPHEMPCYLNSLDIIVFPSIYPEAFGMVAVEAMMLGKPIVSFGIGGSGEFTHHLITGILVNELTPTALAWGILKLIDNEQLRKELGLSAQRFCKTYFSTENSVIRYNGILLELLSNYTKNKEVFT